MLSQVPYWPDADQWEIAHHTVARSGVDSFIRRAVVHMDQVLERKADIEKTVEQMKALAGAKAQGDLPFNRRACDMWGGCKHQSICKAFKENKMVLSQEEQSESDTRFENIELFSISQIERLLDDINRRWRLLHQDLNRRVGENGFALRTGEEIGNVLGNGG